MGRASGIGESLSLLVNSLVLLPSFAASSRLLLDTGRSSTILCHLLDHFLSDYGAFAGRFRCFADVHRLLLPLLVFLLPESSALPFL